MGRYEVRIGGFGGQGVVTMAVVSIGPIILNKNPAVAFARPVNQAFVKMWMLVLIPIMNAQPLTATLATVMAQEPVISILVENKEPVLTAITVTTVTLIAN